LLICGLGVIDRRKKPDVKNLVTLSLSDRLHAYYTTVGKLQEQHHVTSLHWKVLHMTDNII
jgi:hypothetical protein